MGTVIQQALLIAAKDTKLFVKDRFALAFALLFPLLFVAGFSLAFGSVLPEDELYQITVATQEQPGGLSHEIIESLSQSEDVNVDVLEYAEALAAVEDDRLTGFLAFPADFSARLISGQQTTIEVVAREDAPQQEAALSGFAQSLASQMSNTQTAMVSAFAATLLYTGGVKFLDFESLPQVPAPITYEIEQVAKIKPFQASNFTLPGYLTMFVFFAAAMSAELIARERENQTLERMMSNGVRRHAIVLGKYLATLYRGALQLAVLWTAGIFVFNIDFGVSPAAVILISVLMVLASASAGVLIATFLNTQRSASSAGILVSLVLAPIGGSWWPLFITPEWMQNMAKITPHAWANTGFNKVMLFGAEFGDVVPEMVALSVFAVVLLGVAFWRFRPTPAH